MKKQVVLAIVGLIGATAVVWLFRGTFSRTREIAGGLTVPPLEVADKSSESDGQNSLDRRGVMPPIREARTTGDGSVAPLEGVCLLLHDAMTGQPLRVGTILATPAAAQARFGLPSSDLQQLPENVRILLVENSIPESLELREGEDALWVSSPGYAWKAVHLLQGVALVNVGLDPIGQLKLTVGELDFSCLPVLRGTGAQSAAEIKLYHQERLVRIREFQNLPVDGQTVIQTVGNETFDIGMLSVGAYRAVMRSYSPLGAGLSLGSQAIVISPHVTTDVSLDTAAADSVGGNIKVIVSRSDSESRPIQDSVRSISLYSLSDNNSIRMGTDNAPVWNEIEPNSLWEADYYCLEPGTYRVKISPLGLAQEVTLYPGSDEVLVFEVGSVASVAVDVGKCFLDNSMSRLLWGYLDQPREAHQSLTIAQQERVVFNCIAKPIWVQLLGHPLGSPMVNAAPIFANETIIQLPCERAQGASLRLVVIPDSPGRALNSDFWMELEAQAVVGGGALQRVIPEWDGATGILGGYPVGALSAVLVFDEPGDYHLSYRLADGTIKSRTVTAGASPVNLTEVQWN